MRCNRVTVLGAVLGGLAVLGLVVWFAAGAAPAGTFTVGRVDSWNDFTVAGMEPSSEEVERLRVSPPAEEKEAALGRIRQVVAKELAPPEMGDETVALKGWEGRNAFVVRERMGEWIVQITDDAGRTMVEVRQADGSAIAESPEALASWALKAAPKVLAGDLVAGELHETRSRPNRLLTWKPEESRRSDPRGEVEVVVFVHGEGKWVRYTIVRTLVHSARFGGPPGYAFGPDSPYAPRKPAVREPMTEEEYRRQVEEARREQMERVPKEAYRGGFAPGARAKPTRELTPEELANQAN